MPMQKALIILSLFGCPDGAASGAAECDALAVPAPAYASQAACETRIDAALETLADAPYPVVVAHCGTLEETAEVLLDLVPSPALATLEKLQDAPS